jgi:hypothetical protein
MLCFFGFHLVMFTPWCSINLDHVFSTWCFTSWITCHAMHFCLLPCS